MTHNSRTAQINVKDQIKKGVNQIDASSHIGEITSKVLVQQVFNATHPFDTLEIMLATFKRKNTPTISLHLIDFKTNVLLWTHNVNAVDVKDNAWLSVILPTQVPSNSSEYLLEVKSPEATDGNAFTVRASKSSITGFSLHINNKKIDKTLAFKTFDASDSVQTSGYQFENRDNIRYRVSKDYINGHGAEIGAGAYPSLLPQKCKCNYFDTRNREELGRYFGAMSIPLDHVYNIKEFRRILTNGADFIIAHNVLEHCPNPIQTLKHWHELCKDGGKMVLSVPQNGFGPDGNRLPATFEHLLFDYLMVRQASDFDTREHLYSSMTGFDKSSFSGIGKLDQARMTHELAREINVDAHWHVFTVETLRQTIEAAAYFSGRTVEICSLASANHETTRYRTEGELIMTYKLSSQSLDIVARPHPDIEVELHRSKNKLEKALALLAGHS